MAGPSESHYDAVLDAIEEGDVVPLLGAGANICGRPKEEPWHPGSDLPGGGDLARHLANEFRYPLAGEPELARISQYIALVRGYAPLYRELHGIFDADYTPTVIHTFLAGLPSLMRKAGREPRFQLIVTTNYDDGLEQAFRAAAEPFDLVSYKAEGEHRGRFVHWPPDGDPRVIAIPNEYGGLSLDARTIILKLHGLVERGTSPARWESFVITEDHYIDYVARSNVADFLPETLAEKLHNCNLLFLGYSMRDWNLRVLLHRIWSDRDLSWSAWAVQIDPDEIDVKWWSSRGVEILDVALDEYVRGLTDRLESPSQPRA